MANCRAGKDGCIKYFSWADYSSTYIRVLVFPPLPALGITEGAIFDGGRSPTGIYNTNNIIRMRTSLTEMGFQPPDDILNIGDRHPLWRHLNRYLTAQQLTE